MEDRRLIEAAKEIASGAEQYKRLVKRGRGIVKGQFKYLEEVARESLGGAPAEEIADAVWVWNVVGLLAAQVYLAVRSQAGSREEAVGAVVHLLSPVGAHLLRERLRALLDLQDLVKYFERRLGGGRP
jgi:hypothetical protein